MYNGPKTSKESLELTGSQAYAAAAGSPNRNYATQVATNGAEIYGDLRVIEFANEMAERFETLMAGAGFALTLRAEIHHLKEKYGV